MTVTRTVLKPGTSSRKPKTGEMVMAHYVGRYDNVVDIKNDGSQSQLHGQQKKVFDDSRSRDKPLTFIIGIGSVIRGWDVGIMEMELGEVALLKVSSDDGYGKEGLVSQVDGSVQIPPDTDLEFEVELLQIGDEKASSPSSCAVM